MSKLICLPRKFVNTKLLKALKDGELQVKNLMAIKTSKARREVFEKYMPKAEAKFANAKFEKAIATNKRRAYNDYAKIFKGQKKRKQSFLDTIAKLNDSDLLKPKENQPFYEDLVAEEMGLTLTEEEASKINELSKELEAIKEKGEKMEVKIGENTIEIDNPSNEYTNKKTEIIEYGQSLSPNSVVKLLTQVWAKAFMLSGVKSTGVNIVGNEAMSIALNAVRTAKYKRLTGYNSKLANGIKSAYRKSAKETGFDYSRTWGLDEKKIRGENIVHTQGKGKFRMATRWIEKNVFGKLFFGPDYFFATDHFFKTLDLETSKMADEKFKKGGTKEEIQKYAAKLMIEASAISPKSVQEGGMKGAIEARETAMQQALEGTFTNDTWFSEVALSVRKLMNKATGDYSVGDLNIPFAKTPANVVDATITFAAVKSPLEFYRVVEGKRTGNAEMTKKGIDGLMRAGVGLTGAFMLVGLLDPDDYVSEYADYYPSEKQLIALEGATYNSIKIGNTWISLDYFGPLAASLVGMMNARKYGKTLPDNIARYYVGAVKQSLKIPGFNELNEALEGIKGTFFKASKEGISAIYGDIATSAAGFTASRAIPAIVGDVAIGMDEYARKADSPLGKFMARLPGFTGVGRTKLPKKIGLFGDEERTNQFDSKLESFGSQVFFGSRVKTAKESDIISEINRLSLSGAMPSISSVEYTSSRAKVLKMFMGADKFNAFMQDLGGNLDKSWNKLISAKAYDRLPDEKKRDAFNKIRTRIVNAMIKKHIGKADDDIKKQIVEELNK